MYIVKCINVKTIYTIINYTKTLNLMFFSIHIVVEYMNSWDTNHDVKKIVMIHAKPLILHRLQCQYLLWLLIDFSNCLAGTSQTNWKVSIPIFTPLNSILSFCKLLHFVKNSRTISSTLDGFLLP